MKICKTLLLKSSLLFLLSINSIICFAKDDISDSQLRQLFIVTDVNNLRYEKLYGGVVLFKQFFDLAGNACILKKSAPTLTIFTDQEGGEVVRLKDPPPAAKLAKNFTLENFKQQVFKSGKSLKEACVDVNLAPVVEINQYNSRSYGDNKKQVETFATAFANAMHENNIATVNKHFPGQTEDCHAVTDLTKLGIKIKAKSEALTCKIDDVKSFQKKMETFVNVPSDMIMVSSIIYPQISPYPSFLEPKNNALLRNQLHYKGIIISDALWEIEATPETIVRVLKTVDWVMVGYGKSVEESLPAIRKAISEGYLTNSELKEKLQRIDKFKNRTHNLNK